MDGGQRYWAFLSYSHEDSRQAGWLHRALESYALPARLVGRATPAGPAPRRLRPVFKDREDLAADPDLRARVDAALGAAASLIVLCSPAAARSKWVDDEIVRFKALHGKHRVFAVIVSGLPNASLLPGREDEECFPPALRLHHLAAAIPGDENAELIAADLRPEADGRALARLKLIAGILGLDLDELIQRDARRRGRQLATLAAASLAGAAVMGALAVAAVVSRNEARAQRAQAEGLVEFMLGDLRKKLEPTGRLDVLDAVGARALAYYSAEARHGLGDDALGRRARVLHLLGELRDERGDLAGALKDFQQAQPVTAELLARKPDDPNRIFNHAQSVYWVGYIANRRGQDDVAEKQFLDYRRLAAKLVALEPGKDAWRMELIYANSDLGTLLLRSGRTQAAVEAFSSALTAITAVTEKSPDDRDSQKVLAQVYAWLADARLAGGGVSEAMASRQGERAVYERMLARQRGDAVAEEALVVNGVAVARILAMQGRTREAITELRASTARSESLMDLQPDNTDYQAQAGFAYAALARAFLANHDVAAASSAANRDLGLAEALVRKDPTVAIWRGSMLGEARVVRIKIAAYGAPGLSARRLALAPAAPEAERLRGLERSGPANISLGRIAAEASLLAGDYESLANAPDRAQADWKAAIDIATRHGMAQPARALDHGRIVLTQAQANLLRSGLNGGERPAQRKRPNRPVDFITTDDLSQ
jgi:tetratricopeptide (TPR) repeat protein